MITRKRSAQINKEENERATKRPKVALPEQTEEPTPSVVDQQNIWAQEIHWTAPVDLATKLVVSDPLTLHQWMEQRKNRPDLFGDKFQTFLATHHTLLKERIDPKAFAPSEPQAEGAPNLTLIWEYILSLSDPSTPSDKFQQLKPIEKQILRLLLQNLKKYLEGPNREEYLNCLRQFDEDYTTNFEQFQQAHLQTRTPKEPKKQRSKPKEQRKKPKSRNDHQETDWWNDDDGEFVG